MRRLHRIALAVLPLALICIAACSEGGSEPAASGQPYMTTAADALPVDDADTVNFPIDLTINDVPGNIREWIILSPVVREAYARRILAAYAAGQTTDIHSNTLPIIYWLARAPDLRTAAASHHSSRAETDLANRIRMSSRGQFPIQTLAAWRRHFARQLGEDAATLNPF